MGCITGKINRHCFQRTSEQFANFSKPGCRKQQLRIITTGIKGKTRNQRIARMTIKELGRRWREVLTDDEKASFTARGKRNGTGGFLVYRIHHFRAVYNELQISTP